MKRSKFSEPQIFKVLKQGESGIAVSDICRDHGISSATYYKWRSKYGGMEISMLKKMKELEGENFKLKRMYAEAAMDNETLKEILAGKYSGPSSAL